MAQKPTIFINPKFKNIHVNPNFLQQSNNIHVNPKFFVGTNLIAFQPPPPSEPPIKPPLPPTPTVSNNAIIRNTRRSLIRAPAVASRSFNVPIALSQSKDTISTKLPIQRQHQQPQPQLIKISKTKLVSASHLMKFQQKENEMIKNTTESIIKTKKLQRKAEEPESVYKLDRRTQKKKKIVSTYSIRSVSPKKSMISNRKT